ncbi:MAG: LysR family transcriptional regulator [Candidatus Dormibacteraceae bacterium]
MRQLEYVIAIAEEGTVTAAARRLFVTQSALSHQLRDLERELGGPLFQRLGRSMRPTALGRAILGDARAAVAAAHRVVRTARAVTEGEEGDLIVATVLSVAAGVLRRTLAGWANAKPRVTTHLREFQHKSALEAAVAQGGADVALGPRPSNWDGSLLSLGAEEFVVVLPTGDEADDGSGFVDLATLADRRWVLYHPDHGLAQLVAAACARVGFAPHGIVHTWQVELAARLAAVGLGPAMIPDNAVPPGLEATICRQRKPVLRELTAFAPGTFGSLASAYLDVLLDSDLRLQSVPDGAIPDRTNALLSV